MGRRIAAVDPAVCGPCVTQSRFGTHWSGAQYPRDALFKGRNIQELSVGDTSVGDPSTLHPESGTLAKIKVFASLLPNPFDTSQTALKSKH